MLKNRSVRSVLKNCFCIIVLPAVCFPDNSPLLSDQFIPPIDTVDIQRDQVPLPVLVPLTKYVTIGPIPGGNEQNPVSISIEDAMHLQVTFLRDSLPKDDAVQFLTVNITLYTKKGTLYNKIVKRAFTYAKQSDVEADRAVLRRLAERIVPFGYVSERKIERVMVLNDTVPGWTLMEVEVVPDEEYTKFAERLRYGIRSYYRIKGNQIESNFFLGIPKVLYDSDKHDTITYGNASAIFRFNYLNEESGKPYPVNIGIGTFGVNSPIDVNKNGGGFVLSVMLDLIQSVSSIFDLNISPKINAGVEITPFFPIQHRARMLLNARIGFSP